MLKYENPHLVHDQTCMTDHIPEWHAAVVMDMHWGRRRCRRRRGHRGTGAGAALGMQPHTARSYQMQEAADWLQDFAQAPGPLSFSFLVYGGVVDRQGPCSP